MKNIVHILLLLIAFSFCLFAQRGPGPFGRGQKGPMKKIMELERIKLIEALNMNEETTLKFFARRNEQQKNIMSLEDNLDNIMNEMESELKNEKDINQVKLKKLTDDFYSVTTDIHKTKNDFLISLKDILSPEQIATLIIFDKKFREEMREILMKQRQKRRGENMP